MRVTTRPITDQDHEILAEIYASTRREELEQVPWSPEDKQAFLRSQFEAQHAHYQSYFASAEFCLLLSEGKTIGRLYVDRRDDEIRLVDIALLPEHRGSGIGTFLLTSLLAEAEEAGLPLRIHVEHNNLAMRLYLRLGFRKIDESGIYHLMEWTAHSETD